MELVGDDEHVGNDAVFAILRDPDERRVFAPLLGGAATAEDRERYRAFLVARGDVRGEVLGLALALASDPPPPDADARRARLTSLLSHVDRGWWRLVRDDRLPLNCGAAAGRAPAVRFAYACPRSWEELAPTGDAAVRRCGACGEDVHRADTVIAAEALARQGRCIAVPGAIVEAAGYPQGRRMMVGRPAHPARAWAERLFGPLPPWDQR